MIAEGGLRRRRLLAAAAVAALSTLGAAPIFAWGRTGHRIVARIAERHLCATARREADRLLAPESLTQASTWADWIRSDPDWKRAEPWHFVDIPDGATYASSVKNPRGDVVVAIRRFATTLGDPTAARDDRVIALEFLVHLVGDVHQPLHVGRPSDHGGHDVRVFWFGRPTDLHWVWDSAMIQGEELSYTEYAEFLDHPTAEEVSAWQRSDVLDWVRESYALRDAAYAVGDGHLGYAYDFHNLPIVERRLLQAGVRLAGMLDRLLAPPTRSPAAP